MIWLLWVKYFALGPTRVYEGEKASKIHEPAGFAIPCHSTTCANAKGGERTSASIPRPYLVRKTGRC
jgi:hypothetical protein